MCLVIVVATAITSVAYPLLYFYIHIEDHKKGSFSAVYKWGGQF
jgi:hypothetical protein